MKHIQQQLQVGVKAILTFSDNSFARVYISEIEEFSYLGNEYWFKYEDDETNKQLVNEDCVTETRHFNLNFGLIEIFLLKGYLDFQLEHVDDFDSKLEQFISKNYSESQKTKAIFLFKDLVKVAGEQHIIEQYFNNPEYE